MYEIEGVDEQIAQEAFHLAHHKLPIPTRIVSRAEGAVMTRTPRCSRTIRESSDDELKDRIKRLEEELFQHRLKRFTNQLENTNLIQTARREIARCRTVLSARASGTENGAREAAAGRRRRRSSHGRDARIRRRESTKRRSRAPRARSASSRPTRCRRPWSSPSPAASASAQYNKYMTKRVKYKAHDEKNEYHVGDRVRSSSRARCRRTSAGAWRSSSSARAKRSKRRRLRP